MTPELIETAFTPIMLMVLGIAGLYLLATLSGWLVARMFGGKSRERRRLVFGITTTVAFVAMVWLAFGRLVGQT